jgi:transposase
MLLEIRGIGPEFSAVLWTEAFFRSFANRKQVAAYAVLARIVENRLLLPAIRLILLR